MEFRSPVVALCNFGKCFSPRPVGHPGVLQDCRHSLVRGVRPFEAFIHVLPRFFVEFPRLLTVKMCDLCLASGTSTAIHRCESTHMHQNNCHSTISASLHTPGKHMEKYHQDTTQSWAYRIKVRTWRLASTTFFRKENMTFRRRSVSLACVSLPQIRDFKGLFVTPNSSSAFAVASFNSWPKVAGGYSRHKILL